MVLQTYSGVCSVRDLSAVSKPDYHSQPKSTRKFCTETTSFEENKRRDVGKMAEFGENFVDFRDTISDSARTALEERARRLWKSADAVCFDVDSTVCQVLFWR